MGRFFKLKNNLNWKYILGEVLLLFVGINLAIWFNNWNSSKQSIQDRHTIILKIKDEITNNTKALTLAQNKNTQLTNAFKDFNAYFEENSSRVIATPKEFELLTKTYPTFFKVKDSVKINETQYRYFGGTTIELELPDLSRIAWNTAQSIDATNTFNYDCLYNLESLYNLQDRVTNEINKAADALQKDDAKQLKRILNFLNQLSPQLINNYTNALSNIDRCK